MEEEMEEKEKLERGEIVEKKVATPSEGEKTEKTACTEETNVTNVVQEEDELTEAKCDDRLREIKDEMDKTGHMPRDTSFDRLELSKRRLDQEYREEQQGRYTAGSGMWDQWDGWKLNPNPPPPPPISSGYHQHPPPPAPLPHNGHQYHHMNGHHPYENGHSKPYR